MEQLQSQVKKTALKPERSERLLSQGAVILINFNIHLSVEEISNDTVKVKARKLKGNNIKRADILQFTYLYLLKYIPKKFRIQIVL